MDRVVALVLDESKWLTVSMGGAMLAVAILLLGTRHAAVPRRARVAAAMSLGFGMTIGGMAFGHLLAVSTRLALGTLQGSLTVLYAIGIALAVPSWWLIIHARRMPAPGEGQERRTLILNSWVALTLVALGLPNLPLAAPGLLNVGYVMHRRREVGWLLVGLSVVLHAGLFIGSLVFLASGQSFEQFRGMGA